MTFFGFTFSIGNILSRPPAACVDRPADRGQTQPMMMQLVNQVWEGIQESN